MVSSYSRCKLGKRCVKKTKNNKVFIKFTLVCAINSKGVIGWTLYESGGMTGDRMSSFINEFIKNKYKYNLIIMDNGGAHKKECVKEIINKTKNTLLYSVPYRPKTNAIESWFSQFKHYFKHEETGITFSELKKSVKKAIGKIPLNSYLNYMKYAYKNKNVRKYTEKYSSRRKQLKKYKA
jgi:transposase